MKNLNDLAAVLLPVVFVLVCVRIGFEAIGPVLLPLAILALAALIAWVWLNRIP